MGVRIGLRLEVGNPLDAAVYEIVSIDGPEAPRYPVALRLVKASARILNDWRVYAERHGLDVAEYRKVMREALFSVPAGWIDLPFVRPVTGRSAA